MVAGADKINNSQIKVPSAIRVAMERAVWAGLLCPPACVINVAVVYGSVAYDETWWHHQRREWRIKSGIICLFALSGFSMAAIESLERRQIPALA